MSFSSPICTRCGNPVPVEFLNAPALTDCPSCGTLIRVHVFPALFNAPESGQRSEALMMDGEAGCFYHPHKKALVPCDLCGRFLCGLCDLELDGRHLCPSCVETGKRKGKLKNLENHRILYDRIALAMVLWPFLIWPMMIFTAPAAIFVAIRYWRAPASLVSRSKFISVLAIVLATMQITGWAALAMLIAHSLMGGT